MTSSPAPKPTVGNTPELVGMYLLNYPAPLVRNDAQSNLIEDPDALAALEELGRALAKLLKRTGSVGNILACPGKYMLEVYIDPSKCGHIEKPEAYVSSLVEKLSFDCEELERNAHKQKPKSAAELGVRDNELKLIEILAKARKAEDSVTITQIGSNFLAKIRSTSIDAIDALPKNKKAQQGIDGRVTGLGIGDEGGTRIEINQKLMVFVPCLSMDDAFSQLRAGRHLRGTMRRDGICVMEKWEFHDGEPGAGVIEDIWGSLAD